MRKILLTSTGFENKKFEKLFLSNIGKEVDQIKVIFVPTAAIDDDAKEMLPKCMDDLLNAGILPENILTYDLDYLISFDEAKKYDAIYFCGGTSEHLLNEINKSGFNFILNKLVDEGMFYIGVSAGSVIASNEYLDNLGYIDCYVDVHCENGSHCGIIENNDDIFLTDNQAIWICNDVKEIIM